MWIVIVVQLLHLIISYLKFKKVKQNVKHKITKINAPTSNYVFSPLGSRKAKGSAVLIVKMLLLFNNNKAFIHRNIMKTDTLVYI